MALLSETLNEEEEAGKKVLAQAQPLLEEASSEAQGGEMEDESDEDVPAKRAASIGKHPTKRSAR
nr:hypothetical protein [Edaphobacter aggregans]